MSRYDGLRALTGGNKIAAKRQPLDAARLRRDVERERRAGIPMPGFHSVDAVPMRALAGGEQKIDRGRGGTAGNLTRSAKRLTERTALRMRHKIEEPDQILRGQRRHQSGSQNRFLRSRISANTFHAGLPASPTAFATSASSARRNGLAGFSAAVVAGIVGLPEGVSFD